MKKVKMTMSEDNMTFSQGYDEFILYCKSRNLRPGTIRHYNDTISCIYRFIEPETPIGSINHATVDKFIIDCKTKLEIKDITIHTYLRALKTILYYFMKMGYMEQFHITLIKYDKPIVETYTDNEVRALLKEPNKKKCSFVEYRDWVICNLLYATGMRCSNIINLKVGDIDLYNNLITLKTTKNRKHSVIPMSKSLIPILRHYIGTRKGDNDDYVFCTVYGDKFKRESLGVSMADYNKKRGILKTGIHRWRHTFAKQWILNHGDIFKLQKILNHSNLDMVRNYVNIFTSDLESDFDLYNPLETIQQSSKKSKFKK